METLFQSLQKFPTQTGHTMRQVTNNSIPDVIGRGWNLLILRMTKPEGHKLLITDRVREAA